MPKSSDSGMTPKTSPSSDHQGISPDGKRTSRPGGPMVQKNKDLPPEFMTPPQPSKSGGPLPPAIIPPSKPGPGLMPLPENSSQSKEGSGFPAFTPPGAGTDQKSPPMIISPPESKPGEVSRPKAAEIRRSSGKKPFPTSPPPDSKPGVMPPSLPNIPSESKNGGNPAQ